MHVPYGLHFLQEKKMKRGALVKMSCFSGGFFVMSRHMFSKCSCNLTADVLHMLHCCSLCSSSSFSDSGKSEADSFIFIESNIK